MKRIEAIIKTEKLGTILEALDRKWKGGYYFLETKGHGQRKASGNPETGCRPRPLEKSKLVLVVEDSLAESIIEHLLHLAVTGSNGDGKIIISEIGDAVKIRTGSRGTMAL